MPHKEHEGKKLSKSLFRAAEWIVRVHTEYIHTLNGGVKPNWDQAAHNCHLAESSQSLLDWIVLDGI